MSLTSEQLLDPPLWWPHSPLAWIELVDLLLQLDLAVPAQIKDEASWTLLTSLNNRNYRLQCEQLKFFVQFPSERNLEKLPGGSFVKTNQLVAQQVRLLPWLIPCLHESPSLRVFDWLDAAKLHRHKAEQKLFFPQLARFLAELHTSSLPLPALDMKAHLEHYYQLARARQLTSPAKIEQVYQQALVLVSQFHSSCSCHNDLSPDNILLTSQGELKVIDWEYARQGDPLFDLAGVVLMFELEEETESFMLQNYSQAMGQVIPVDRYQALKKLYQLLLQLWPLA